MLCAAIQLEALRSASWHLPAQVLQTNRARWPELFDLVMRRLESSERFDLLHVWKGSAATGGPDSVATSDLMSVVAASIRDMKLEV